MKKSLILILAIFVAASAVSKSNADVWDGPSIEFTKTGFSDWTLAENQDFITSNVIITRANTQGIFNIAQEASYSAFSSPADTEWAFGTTADLGTLSFFDWQTWNGSNPPAMVGQDAVLHLISEDIFIDIRFTAWGIGTGAGGSFSYIRSTNSIPEPSTGLMLLSLGSIFALRRRR